MPGSASELPVHPVRVCDTKVERREKLKESRKILAYPYFRPLGQPRRARGDPLTGRRLSRRRGFVHFVRFRKTPVLLVFIRVHLRSSAANMGFWFSRWAGRKAKPHIDRKSTRLNSSHLVISYAVFCLKKKK